MKEIETISDPLPPTMFITKASTINSEITNSNKYFFVFIFHFFLRFFF